MTDSPAPLVSVVLGTYNRKAFLKAAIRSIRENAAPFPVEIIVVDGGSTDGTQQWLLRQRDVLTIIHHNREIRGGVSKRKHSWGYFMNLGFKCAHGTYLCMISDDSVLVKGALAAGVRHIEMLRAQGRNIGAAAFYWRNWFVDEHFFVGLTLGDRMFVNHGLYLRSALADVDWIDEVSYDFYCADGDLCLRLWEKGYEVVDCPDAYVEHFPTANKKVRDGNAATVSQDRSRYEARWRHLPPKRQGDWMYRKHTDPMRSYRLFPVVARTRVIMSVTCERLRQRLRSRVRQTGLVDLARRLGLRGGPRP